MTHVLLAAALALTTTNSDVSQPVTTAVARLRDASSYSWTSTTELPGAPFRIAPSIGRLDDHGLVLREAGPPPVEAVTAKDRTAVRVHGAWHPLAALVDENDALLTAVRDLLAVPVPANELTELLPPETELRLGPGGLYEAALSARGAGLLFAGLMQRRGPRGLAISEAKGTIRVWLENGWPAKYEVNAEGVLRMPFGTKTLKRRTVVTITAINTTAFAIPAGAAAVLESRP